MLSFFSQQTENTKSVSHAQSYVAIAATEYGSNMNLVPLINGELDESFKEKPIFNLFIGNKKFENFEEAINYANSQGVSENSAYVLGLICPINEIDDYRARGQFSELIISITNAMTRKAVTKASDLSISSTNVHRVT